MNREEYNRSVDRFADNVFRFIRGLCRSRALAEDVTQDAFLRLWEALPAVDGDKARAFLFATAYHRLVDVLRREKKFVAAEALESRAGACAGVHVDLREVLEAALARLPVVQQTVLMLRDYEDYSYREIATITSLTEVQVKVYIFRARVAMKEFLRSPDKII
ncbi:MAG: RNA polymerase sigma factor [Odoribacteraceae bacterium]|jgi:RNA polymerase sigma-70 factor (ECF subfamily)|nr:RNA polymerase sigma factor [Odoribacteraceae bacterium]